MDRASALQEFHEKIVGITQTAKEKREIYARIAEGDVNVIIGTHALIQEKVVYRRLSLVVTDEQHRFGVRQRELLADKGTGTHVLVMSATPIPRTLAIVVYGDLHVSVLDEMPAGRKPIKNCVVNTSYRQTAYNFIRKQTEEGRQVYVICPMVEEGEMDGLENVMDYTDKLKAVLPSAIRVAALHGKMKSAEKNRIMEAFSRNQCSQRHGYDGGKCGTLRTGTASSASRTGGKRRFPELLYFYQRK